MNTILWFGQIPQAGVHERLEKRGYHIDISPAPSHLDNGRLSSARIATFHFPNEDDIPSSLPKIAQMIDHEIRIIVVAPRESRQKIMALLEKISTDFDWIKNVIFIDDLRDTSFDNFINLPPVKKWRSVKIVLKKGNRDLLEEEKLLIGRAFSKAEEIHLEEIGEGYSGARVFLAHEKRQENSIAHWAQLRLVKIDTRNDLEIEVGNMQAVSPFVPFELRPNLDVHVRGFRKSLFIADFVENSESMLEASRAGRAESAISNLFNRTLHRWRERARHCPLSNESLVAASERLKMVTPEKIKATYSDTQEFQDLGLNLNDLWQALQKIKFDHHAATIHGDLHGKNIRVRADDAILIDLGSVKGKDGLGAPLCFDVAMLEIALIFDCTESETTGTFDDPEWRDAIEHYYRLAAIQRMPDRASVKPTWWRHNCLQRLRSYAIYNQSNKYEYAIALVIAMWRWCKFDPIKNNEADRGRRTTALKLGAILAAEIVENWNYENKPNP